MSDQKNILDEKQVSDDSVDFPSTKEELTHPISHEVNAQQIEQDEKRKNKRAEIDAPVFVYDLTGQLLSKAKATSVSEMGAGLTLDQKIDLQPGIELSLEFNGSAIPGFTLKAEVTDSREEEHGTAVSLKFTQISMLSQKHLRAYIEQH